MLVETVRLQERNTRVRVRLMYHHTSQIREEDIITISLRIADLRGLRKVLRELLGEIDVAVAKEGFAAAAGPDRTAELRTFAQHIIKARRARVPLFSKSMFGEPAWDMLLELYLNKDRGRRHSVGRLCELSGAPPTTALRWLDYLEKEKFVVREANPTDRRTEFVEITDKGRTTMEQYLSETTLAQP